MKLIPITALIAAALLSAAQLAGAEETNADTQAGANAPKPLTRAQVKADLALWRESGMQELEREERLGDTTSARYRQAKARYEALREAAEQKPQAGAASAAAR